MCIFVTESEAVDCEWNESDNIIRRRRRAFCRRVEGFVEVCRCNHPAPIVFSPAVVYLALCCFCCNVYIEAPH